MGKLYTLDSKLLVGTPEIRVGDKVYPVDDRKKTVEKLDEVLNEAGAEKQKQADAVLKLALGEKAWRELDNMNMPFAAWQKLMELVLAAMVGQEPEEAETFFREKEKKE